MIDDQEQARGLQLITFQLGELNFGIDIMAIREIRAWSPTTTLPHVPAHVRGVVNLRGVVLPVIDLSARLGWGLIQPTARHVIIVVHIGEQLQGLIVDAVTDVVNISSGDIQPAPETGAGPANHYLEGLVPVGDRMVMLLALERLAGDSAALAEAA
jgi:purine-binding chemotaxis protein CheW